MQHDQFIGKQLDDFIIEERIGRGGMSVVYRAFQPSINRQVALKIITLTQELGEQNEFRRRFAQEAAMIAKLEHIHILPIYDYGIVDDEVAFLAMRLLRGGSLSDLLVDGALSLDRTGDLFGQVARGIAYAHSKNVIHRDIKPSNILLDDSGNAYVTDFGLAKMMGESLHLTKPGNIVGTPAYMAPEQLRGESIDHHADIYSLGVVLYHMLTGRPPFEASDTNIISVIYQHLEKVPQPPSDLNPDVPFEVEAVVMRALEKKPEDRFQSAEEMAGELDMALGRKVSTSSYPAARPISKPSTPSAVKPSAVSPVRRYLPIVVALALVVAIIVAVVVIPLFSRPEVHPPTVLAGRVSSAGEIVPTQAEISLAIGRMGTTGFIAYVTCNQSSEYHATQIREMRDFASLYGLAFRIYDSDSDKTKQTPLIEKARAEGALGLIICPLEINLLDGTLRSAQAAGIPIAFMASGIPNYGGVLLAGDDYEMGLKAGGLAGEIIADELGGNADVVVLNYPELNSLVVRATGLEAGVVKYAPRAHIVARVLGATPENGEASIKKLLEDGIDFNVIVSINDAGSYGAIKALEAAGMAPDSVIITSVDAEAVARDYIRNNYFMRGSLEVGRTQFARASIDAMVKLLAGATMPETILVPPGDMVTKETLTRANG